MSTMHSRVLDFMSPISISNQRLSSNVAVTMASSAGLPLQPIHHMSMNLPQFPGHPSPSALMAASATNGWPYPHPLNSVDPQSESWADNWRQFQQAAWAYNLDPSMIALYQGVTPSMDGSRRKNATRETTSMLKAWLNEHRKNPYPTKGEKIMLAIITKMSLTQVSTWFANARRRLKKENKMTWAPRNRLEEERRASSRDSAENDDDPDDSSHEDEDEDDDLMDVYIGEGKNENEYESSENKIIEVEESYQEPALIKPRIWSLVDTATKLDTPRNLQPVISSSSSCSSSSSICSNEINLPPPTFPCQQNSPTFSPWCLSSLSSAQTNPFSNQTTALPLQQLNIHQTPLNLHPYSVFSHNTIKETANVKHEAFGMPFGMPFWNAAADRFAPYSTNKSNTTESKMSGFGSSSPTPI